MSNYSDKQSRKQPGKLIILAGILLVALLVLFAIMLPGKKISLHPELTMEAGDFLPAAEKFLAQTTKEQIAYSDTSAVQEDVPGVYDVMLTCGRREYSAKIRVVDTVAPLISGVTDKTIYVGETISYMRGVTVSDNLDAAPALDVDRSKVDLSVPGEYIVIYTAADASGNVTAVESKVTVLEKAQSDISYDTIYEEVDILLSEIVDEDMTLQDKVSAVYQWIRTNCSYVNHSEKGDWMLAAYQMMVQRKGDCFNYYSLCKLMLDRLEIPNLEVRKVKNYEGDIDHYWSLVSLDGGNTWYHMDTTPRPDATSFCLVTDSFMDDYSATHGNCFNRDKTLYPTTPEEDL